MSLESYDAIALAFGQNLVSRSMTLTPPRPSWIHATHSSAASFCLISFYTLCSSAHLPHTTPHTSHITHTHHGLKSHPAREQGLCREARLCRPVSRRSRSQLRSPPRQTFLSLLGAHEPGSTLTMPSTSTLRCVLRPAVIDPSTHPAPLTHRTTPTLSRTLWPCTA